MQQYESQWGPWGHWWRMLVGGVVAGGSSAVGILLSCVVLMQPLLPLWRRVLIGGIALEALLVSLLALAFLRVRWAAYTAVSSAPPRASSCGEATPRQLIPEAARPRLSSTQIVRR